jgi:hypothetical protein
LMSLSQKTTDREAGERTRSTGHSETNALEI